LLCATRTIEETAAVAIQIAETRPATFAQAVGNASARTIYPIGHREEDL
jgi:hypothetical protein